MKDHLSITIAKHEGCFYASCPLFQMGDSPLKASTEEGAKIEALDIISQKAQAIEKICHDQKIKILNCPYDNGGKKSDIIPQ